MRKGIAVFAIFLFLSQGWARPVRAQGEAESKWLPVIRSAVFPGSGQISQGRYWQGVVFGGLAIVSVTGLIVADINYQRTKEDIDSKVQAYNTTTSADEAFELFQSFPALSDQEESRWTWRQAFVVGVVAVWAVNLIDVFLVGPKESEPFLEPEVEPSAKLGLTPMKDGWALSATFRF